MQRRWYQIHLSTALIAMLTTAVVLGINLRATADSLNTVSYGWPARVVLQFTDSDARVIYEENLFVNVLVVLLLAAAVAFAVENVVRRVRRA